MSSEIIKPTGGVRPFVRKQEICYQVVIRGEDLEKIEWLRARYKPKSTIQETVLWLIRRVFERNKAKEVIKTNGEDVHHNR